MLFNAFEINKVGEFEDGNGETCCEPIFDPADDGDRYDRVFWTVYGRKPDDCVEALIDRNEKEDAQAIYEFFCTLLKVYEDEYGLG